MSGPPLRIALVIATRDRAGVLVATLRAVHAQLTPPGAVFVVDDASSDETCELLARDFPEVRVLRTDENLGVNGCLALGMRAAMQGDFDAFWILDDDTVPAADALQELVAALRASPEAAGVGYQGGTVTWGTIRHRKASEEVRRLRPLGPRMREVDFFLLDGALITRAAVEAVGYPWEGYFMMIGDIEFPYRMTRAGLRLGVVERDRLERANLGGRDGGSGKPAWRAYYKARNQVWMAKQYRSPLLFLGALARVAHLTVRYTRKGDRQRARALLLGARDGFRGRMGRTVDPSR